MAVPTADEQKIRELVLEVLKNGYLMSLGVEDQGGVWVSDVIYVSDGDLNIYWTSQEDARHSRALEFEPRAAATITVSNGRGEENVGVQISGIAKKIDGENYELSVAHCVKRGKPIPREGQEALRPGQSWYIFKPKLIELIHQSLFGFEKHGLELN